MNVNYSNNSICTYFLNVAEFAEKDHFSPYSGSRNFYFVMKSKIRPGI